MKVLGRCVAVLLGLCAVDGTASLSAQAAAPSAPSAAPWITHTDSSVILGEQRRIRVVMPSGYANSPRRYPVLVLLDANDELQFRAAVANVAFLAGRQAIPPMLIIGIENGKDRTRDLTPEPQANGPM